MIWPGMGDPTKRKKTLRFLAFSAGVGAAAVMFTVLVVNPFMGAQPHSACINDMDLNWRISFNVELYADGERLEVPDNVGFMDGGCQRALYTLSSDGTAYAEWVEEHTFEIGHFLWIANYPIRDMEQSKSVLYVNGIRSEQLLKHPIQDGATYRAEFVTKEYDAQQDKDFLPPDL